MMKSTIISWHGLFTGECQHDDTHSPAPATVETGVRIQVLIVAFSCVII